MGTRAFTYVLVPVALATKKLFRIFLLLGGGRILLDFIGEWEQKKFIVALSNPFLGFPLLPRPQPFCCIHGARIADPRPQLSGFRFHARYDYTDHPQRCRAN